MERNEWNETVLSRIIEFYGFTDGRNLLEWLSKSAVRHGRYAERLSALEGYFKARAGDFRLPFARNKARLKAG